MSETCKLFVKTSVTILTETLNWRSHLLLQQVSMTVPVTTKHKGHPD
jgi:hypothetical protein